MSNINVAYIASNLQSAVNSYGILFSVGETVEHQDKKAGKAAITGFTLSTELKDILVHTTMGLCTIDFLEKATQHE